MWYSSDAKGISLTSSEKKDPSVAPTGEASNPLSYRDAQATARNRPTRHTVLDIAEQLIQPQRRMQVMTSTDQQALRSEACLASKAVCWPTTMGPRNPQASYNRARYYDQNVGRFLSEDPIWGGEGGKPNFYVYASNDPIDRFDPTGLSDLIFLPGSQTLILLDGNGNIVGIFPAGNNVAPGTHNDDGITPTNPYDPGTYNPGPYHPHPEAADPDSGFGQNGIFLFPRPGCKGCGVHSGRRNRARKRRPSPQFPTHGCIRTTDEATKKILDLTNAGDPLQHLYVR